MIVNWHSGHWLLLLWVVPIIAIAMLLTARWQAKAARSFAKPTMLARLAPGASVLSRFVKIVLVTIALASLVVAVARPRYGTYMKDITTSGLDVCVVLDVSRSMLADDLKPNRLERAKSDILDLADRLEGDRVGLVVFAGTPVMKVPMTTNMSFFKTTLNDVDTTAAPLGGSDIGTAIVKALDSMQERYDRQQAIVLISDGEHHGDFPEEAAKLAKERNVQIVTVGLGDPDEGGRIPARDQSSGLTWLQYNGQEVWSVLQEDVLQDLATKTGGAYIPARTRVYDLGEIYEKQLSGMGSVISDVQKRQRFRERFQIFAALAFGLLVIESLISSLRKRSTRTVST